MTSVSNKEKANHHCTASGTLLWVGATQSWRRKGRRGWHIVCIFIILLKSPPEMKRHQAASLKLLGQDCSTSPSILTQRATVNLWNEAQQHRGG